MRENIQLISIVLFAGAGGETTGNDLARIDGEKVLLTIAAVNHDSIAIESHAMNHLSVNHFVEDVRKLNVHKINDILDYYMKKYPHAKVKLQASLECTNFSKAKGGLPRDADSRTLAETLYMSWDVQEKAFRHGDSYIQILDPDYIIIENVEEFMSWGPLNENGKPISKRAGSDYVKWCNTIKDMGYNYDWRILNSADYGAYTSRKRFFGIFAKPDCPIVYPTSTHAKKPLVKGMFGELKKWKAVREVLDLQDHGNTIFGRKKDLSEKTLARIYAGLIKYVAGGNIANPNGIKVCMMLLTPLIKRFRITAGWISG